MGKDIHRLLKGYPGLNPVNREIRIKYIRWEELKQLQPLSIRHKIRQIYTLLKFVDMKDSRAVTKDDIEDFFIQRRKTVSPARFRVT